MPQWNGGFSQEIRVRVVWQLPAVLTVEVVESAFTGGAHGDYKASLRSDDLRTGHRIPITAVIPDTAAIVPLLERGFIRAKTDSGSSPPPLSTLLFPEVTRLPVPVHFGIVADGVQFLDNPYNVASFPLGARIGAPYFKQLQLRVSAHFSVPTHCSPQVHPHSLNPHTWHFTHPSANSSCDPQSGHVPMNTSP